MRVRSSTSSTQANWSNYYDHIVGTCANPWARAADSATTSGALSNYTETRYMEDIVTPKFHKLRSKGHIINNPYNQIVTMEWITPVSVVQNLVTYQNMCSPQKRVYNGWRISGTADWTDSFRSKYLPAPALNVEAIRDIAITSAFAKNTVNDAMIGATIAEARETVSSLAAIFKRAIRIIVALKKFQLKALAKELTPKELANRYMEARYAIRPLIYDTLQIIDALNNNVRPKRWAVRDFASDSATSTQLGATIRDNGYVRSTGTLTVHREVNARSGVLSVIENISHLQKWGADRWASTAYEVMPLSFVLDWFFNVGKVISSWEPTTGMKHLASWVVVCDTVTQVVTISGTECLWPTSNIQEKVFTASGSAMKVTKTKYRIPNPQRPVLPRFDMKLDALKILDLGLILKNVFKGIPK